MKTITIEFVGGFHHNGNGRITCRLRKIARGSYDIARLSERQSRRLESYFCGYSDCICGGSYRAEAILPLGWAESGPGEYVREHPTSEAAHA
jgi:hypothetical protein